jgi:hypothetical protein
MSDTISNLPDHVHPVISRVFDAFAASVPRGDTFPAAAPNTFLDTKGNPGTLPSDEWSIHLRGNPGGQSMTCAVRPHNGPYHSIEGIADLDTLLAALSSTVGGVSSGTATMVGSTVTVTVPALADGDPAVPVGSTVYATVTTAAGKSKLLSAVRASDSTITISSPGSGFGALLASAGVDGTLVSGVKDITLDNVAGDQLGVIMKTSGGTPGVLSVKRKNDTEVTVQSWLAGTGIQTSDTSVVTVFNFGQAAHETSIVRWAVIRPS